MYLRAKIGENSVIIVIHTLDNDNSSYREHLRTMFISILNIAYVIGTSVNN